MLPEEIEVRRGDQLLVRASSSFVKSDATFRQIAHRWAHLLMADWQVRATSELAGEQPHYTFEFHQVDSAPTRSLSKQQSSTGGESGEDGTGGDGMGDAGDVETDSSGSGGGGGSSSSGGGGGGGDGSEPKFLGSISFPEQL